ncbi:MAG: hypothetical protein DWH97_06305 [Planctomycetota bacterium]|nr:MAG: hypothetical protein DWH97_06305 [Planctomycetota bacterium]RLS92486.1 MAG: hypothetical protein DWI12_11210 [Planctomycetota bacterium]
MASQAREPSIALALLMSGHRRVLRGDLTQTPVPSAAQSLNATELSSDASTAFCESAAPFAVLFDAGATSCSPMATFGIDASQFISLKQSGDFFDATGGAQRDADMVWVAAAVADPGIVIVVVMVPIDSRHIELNMAWVQAETRAIRAVGALLRLSVLVRERITSRSLRVVAALRSEPENRIQWLGDHPDQTGIIAALDRRH